MKKLDLEPNLIAFDTDKNIERRQKGEPTSFRLIRPRTLGYALILLVVSAIMVFALINRSVLELNIQRDRNPLFVTLSDGSIRNGYTIKILNKQQQPRVFNLTLDAPLPLAIKVVGLEGSAQGIKIPVASDTLRALRVFVTKPAGTETKTKFPITFTVTDSPNEISATYEGVFIGGIQ